MKLHNPGGKFVEMEKPKKWICIEEFPGAGFEFFFGFRGGGELFSVGTVQAKNGGPEEADGEESLKEKLFPKIQCGGIAERGEPKNVIGPGRGGIKVQNDPPDSAGENAECRQSPTAPAKAAFSSVTRDETKTPTLREKSISAMRPIAL